MTAAIGFPFANEPRKGSQVVIDGALVCADTKITASDYATSYESKVSVSITPDLRAFAIANSSDDTHAAKMLAGEITSALCHPSATDLVSTIQHTMQTWYSAYSGGGAPRTEFIIASSVNRHCSLFYCSPPNTVLRKSHPFAIGTGARVLEPLFRDELYPLWKLEPTILRAAYWMYRAKKDEGAFVGGKTHAVVMTKEGGFWFLEEMGEAEKLAPQVDELFDVVCLGLFSRNNAKERRSFLSGFSHLFMQLSAEAANIRFDSLKYMRELEQAIKAKRASEAKEK